MSNKPLCLYLAVLGFLSLNPWIKPSGASAFGLVPWDKIDHAVAYAGLTILLIVTLSRAVRGWASVLLAVLAASALGLVTEFCQAWFTAGRMFSYLDAFANGLGAVLGALMLVGFRYLAGHCNWSRTYLRT